MAMVSFHGKQKSINCWGSLNSPCRYLNNISAWRQLFTYVHFRCTLLQRSSANAFIKCSNTVITT